MKKAKIIILFTLFLLSISLFWTVEASDQGNKDIIGTWYGKYYYTYSEKLVPTEFKLIIDRVEVNAFWGVVVEPRTDWGPASLSEFKSSVTGIIDSKFKKIRFIKKLEFAGGHAIYYEGFLQDNNKLSGQWIINEDWTGSWQAEKIK
ncbi:MAG: hypothetical protein ABIJ37_10560 [Pseudomonadota bacterium]